MGDPSFTGFIQITHQQLKSTYNRQYEKHITSSTNTRVKKADEFLTNYGPILCLVTQIFCLFRAGPAYVLGFYLGFAAAIAYCVEVSDWDARIVGEGGMKDAALVTTATSLIFPEIAAFGAGMAFGAKIVHLADENRSGEFFRASHN